MDLRAQTQFFHMFRAMFDAGDVAEMGAQAFTVYAYIKSCVNYEKPEAFPSVETICKVTGLSRATVFRCIPVLVEMGYLIKNTSGRNTVYRVCERIPMLDDDGNVQGTASWEYIPKYAVNAVNELKELLKSSKHPDEARYIHIENLQVVISNVESGAVQNNIMGDISETVTTNVIGTDYLEQLAAEGNAEAAAKLKRMLKGKK